MCAAQRALALDTQLFSLNYKNFLEKVIEGSIELSDDKMITYQAEFLKLSVEKGKTNGEFKACSLVYQTCQFFFGIRGSCARERMNFGRSGLHFKLRENSN